MRYGRTNSILYDFNIDDLINESSLLEENLGVYTDIPSPPTPIVTNPIYGVSWINDTTITMTRTDDATNMNYNINTTTGLINSDFDNVFPWNETEVITDKNNYKFVHFPDMYFRIGKDTNGDINSVAVSKSPTEEGNWYKCNTFDYGCYGGSTVTSAISNLTFLESKSGKTRAGSLTRANFRTYASNNTADGYVYHQLDLKHKTVLNFLWWIEFATKNSQTIMTGHILNSSTSSGSKISTGGTNSLTTPSGYITNTLQMRYHYIEDFTGNMLEFIDGIYCGTTTTPSYVTDDPSYFTDDTNNKQALSWNEPEAGSIMAFGMDSNKPFLVTPTKNVGSTTYSQGFCDRVYNGTTQYPSLVTGAHYSTNSSSTSNATGISYFYKRSLTQTQAYQGARLLRQPISNFS